MTKKELLDNKTFKSLPDDIEIVFNNSTSTSEDFRLELSHLSISQDFGEAPVLVIDALPRNWLESKGLFLMPKK